MEDKSAFDILVETLESFGFKTESSSIYQPIIVTPSERFLSTKYVCCEITDSIYFFASDSYGTKAYTSSTFTGLYSSLETLKDIEYKVIKRDWFDVFNRKRRKTGIDHVDNNVTILSSGWIPYKELSIENIELFLKINTLGYPFSLVIEDNYLSRIKPLKDKKIIAVETNEWVYEKEEVSSSSKSVERSFDHIFRVITPKIMRNIKFFGLYP